MDRIEEKTKTNPLEVLRTALEKVTPEVEVKSKRVGGSTYQVPLEVSPKRGISLAIRWLITSAKNRPEHGMITKLTNEIIEASNGQGAAIRKKDEIHRMAEANKAFAHFR